MIRESDLDKIIYDELQNIREIAQENCRRIDADFRQHIDLYKDGKQLNERYMQSWYQAS